MMEIGRVFVKTAGRDAGKKGVIVDVLEGSFVMVDGQVRRKKCNIRHLEPVKTCLKMEKNAPHETVVAELKKIGIEVAEKKVKETKEKPKRARKVKAKAEPAAKKTAEKPAKKTRKKKTPTS